MPVRVVSVRGQQHPLILSEPVAVGVSGLRGTKQSKKHQTSLTTTLIEPTSATAYLESLRSKSSASEHTPKQTNKATKQTKRKHVRRSRPQRHHRRDSHLARPAFKPRPPKLPREAPATSSRPPRPKRQAHLTRYQSCSVPPPSPLPPSPCPSPPVHRKLTNAPFPLTQRTPIRRLRARETAHHRQSEEIPRAPPRARRSRRAQHPAHLHRGTGDRGPAARAGEAHAGR